MLIFSTFPEAISWRRMRLAPANDYSFEPGFHGEFKYRIKKGGQFWTQNSKNGPENRNIRQKSALFMKFTLDLNTFFNFLTPFSFMFSFFFAGHLVCMAHDEYSYGTAA